MVFIARGVIANGGFVQVDTRLLKRILFGATLCHRFGMGFGGWSTFWHSVRRQLAEWLGVILK